METRCAPVSLQKCNSEHVFNTVKSVWKSPRPCSRIQPEKGWYEFLSVFFQCAPVRPLRVSSTRRADSRSSSRTGGKQGEQKRRTGPLLAAAAGCGGQRTKHGLDSWIPQDADWLLTLTMTARIQVHVQALSRVCSDSTHVLKYKQFVCIFLFFFAKLQESNDTLKAQYCLSPN